MSAAIAAAVTVAATAVGLYSDYKTGQAQDKANKLARRAENARAFRERSAAIRQQRVTAAGAENAAANSGTIGATGVIGQMGALATNTAANIGFANQLDALRSQQLDAVRQAQQFGLLGSVASAASNVVGNYAALQMYKLRTPAPVNLLTGEAVDPTQ